MARRARTKAGTDALLFFNPPTGLVSEMDFNSYEYLLKDNSTPNTYIVIPHQNVAVLILNPSSPDHKQLNNLLMRRGVGDGVLRPAHIPNYNDIYPIRPEYHIFLRWCLGEMFNPRTLTPSLHILDPKPVINFNGPIMNLDNYGIRLCMGTYTDAFQVIKLPPSPHVLNVWVGYDIHTELVPGYHHVQFTPFYGTRAASLVNPPCIPMPKATTVCCWNVRGLARPSLVEHFQQLFELHKPGIVVMLEARQSLENVQLIVPYLPGKYSCVFSAPTGLSGGLVVLWRNDFITVEQRKVQSEYVKQIFISRGIRLLGWVRLSEFVLQRRSVKLLQ